MSLLSMSPAAPTAAKILGGTAAFGIIAAFWSKFLMLVNKVKSIFIVGFSVKGRHDSGEANAIIYYLRQNYKCVGAKKWEFTTEREYRRSKQRYAMSPFKAFMPMNDFVLFVKKWSFVFISLTSQKGDSDSDAG